MNFEQGARPSYIGWMLAVASSSALMLWLRLFDGTLPVLCGWDQNVFLADALALEAGGSLYSSHFQFVTPGAPVTFFALQHILGAQPWLPNAVLLAIGIACAMLTFAIAERVTPKPTAALAALLALALTFAPDATHHRFSVVFVLTAALWLVRKPYSKAAICAAGASLAVAAWYTQTRGGAWLAGFALALVAVSKSRRRGAMDALRLVACGALAFALLLSYYAIHAGAAALWRSLVVFPLRYYGAYTWNSPAAFWADMAINGSARAYLAFALLWLFVACGLVAAVRSPRLRGDRSARLLAIASAVGILPALWSGPTLDRVRYDAALPIVLAVAALAATRFRRAAMVAIAAGVLAYGASPLIRKNVVLRYPAGEVSVPADAAVAEMWFLQSLPARSRVLDLTHAVRYDLYRWQNAGGSQPAFDSSFTRPEQVREIERALTDGCADFVLEDPADEADRIFTRDYRDNLSHVRDLLRRDYRMMVTGSAVYQMVWQGRSGCR